MFQKTLQGAVVVVKSNQPITVENSPELTGLADATLADGQPLVVLDMKTTALIDSAGLEALLTIKQQFENVGGALKLASPVPLCRDILHITGLDREFEIYERLCDAVGSFVR